MPYLYRHIRLDKNEVFYVGIGSDSNYEYTRAHNKKDRNRYWKHIIKVTDYEVHIVIDDISWETACEKEKEFIKLYGRKDLKTGTLVNLTDGGDGNCNPSQEIRDKIIENTKKYKGENHPNYGKHLSEETKRKIGEKSKLRGGENHPNYGKHRSEETKKKISEANKKYVGELNSMYGKKHTEESKANMSKAQIGRKKTPEQIEKHRQKLLGKPLSEEHKEKIRKSHLTRPDIDSTGHVFRKKVHQIDPKTNEILNTFNCITDAANITGASRPKISACCRGKRKTTGGFKWEYVK